MDLFSLPFLPTSYYRLSTVNRLCVKKRSLGNELRAFIFPTLVPLFSMQRKKRKKTRKKNCLNSLNIFFFIFVVFTCNKLGVVTTKKESMARIINFCVCFFLLGERWLFFLWGFCSSNIIFFLGKDDVNKRITITQRTWNDKEHFFLYREGTNFISLPIIAHENVFCTWNGIAFSINPKRGKIWQHFPTQSKRIRPSISYLYSLNHSWTLSHSHINNACK